MAAIRSDGARRSTGIWMAGLACGALLAADPPTVLAIAALFAPSLLMRIADRDHDRRAASAVMLCNGAASITPLAAIWRTGPPDLARVLAVLADPPMLFGAWIAASLAWVGGELLGVIALRVLTIRATRDARALGREIETLRAEWTSDPGAAGG